MLHFKYKTGSKPTLSWSLLSLESCSELKSIIPEKDEVSLGDRHNGPAGPGAGGAGGTQEAGSRRSRRLSPVVEVRHTILGGRVRTRGWAVEDDWPCHSHIPQMGEAL